MAINTGPINADKNRAGQVRGMKRQAWSRSGQLIDRTGQEQAWGRSDRSDVYLFVMTRAALATLELLIIPTSMLENEQCTRS